MNIKGQDPRSFRFYIFKLLFWSTARPTEAKFHVEPQWEGKTKVCSNSLGHMTKVAAMPIYGKSIKNSSTLESEDR